MENPMNKWDDLGGFYTPIFGLTPIWKWGFTSMFMLEKRCVPPNLEDHPQVASVYLGNLA